MHDPMTVAFEFRPLGVTVWHVDPETDGSDDSCGWSRPHLNDIDEKLAKELAEWDDKFPYYFNQSVREVNGRRFVEPGTAIALSLSAIGTIAWRLDRKSLSPWIFQKAAALGFYEHDNLQGFFVGPRSTVEKEHAFMVLIRHYRAWMRPWYKHPKWHIWHWKIQVNFVLNLKRWLFSKCCKCGKPFSWGYGPCTSSWNSSGPRWFKGETDVYHANCDGGGDQAVTETGKS
jgi:hypothetical protein